MNVELLAPTIGRRLVGGVLGARVRVEPGTYEVLSRTSDTTCLIVPYERTRVPRVVVVSNDDLEPATVR